MMQLSIFDTMQDKPPHLEEVAAAFENAFHLLYRHDNDIKPFVTSGQFTVTFPNGRKMLVSYQYKDATN